MVNPENQQHCASRKPYLINHSFAKEVKLADKPGSVVDSHSSRRFVT